MTSPRLTNTELPLVADVIDAITAAAAGDTQAVAQLAERLDPEQAGHALAITVGIAAGCINQITATAGIDLDMFIRQMRQQAAS